MPAPYSVLDVCGHIIKYSSENNKSISNLKLQKVLYFIQAAFLVNRECGCFLESIEAWDFGPVVPEAYRYYKKYGGLSIPSKEGERRCTREDVFGCTYEPVNDDCFEKDDADLINRIVDKLAKFSASYLVEVTHKQSPWKDVYQPYQNNIISKRSIKEYFDGKRHK